MDFSGKTAVVTGGSRGIGRPSVRSWQGARQCGAVLRRPGGGRQETVSACEALGAKALAVQCDVADEAQVKALMDAAVKAFGRIDILVNNAGVTRDGLLMMRRSPTSTP